MQYPKAVWITVLLLFLVFSLSFIHRPAEALEPVTASVGIVGKEVVTSREVKISSLLEQIFVQLEIQTQEQAKGLAEKESVKSKKQTKAQAKANTKKQVQFELQAEPMGSEGFRRSLNKIMVETVVLKEAETLQLSVVSAEEIESLFVKAQPLFEMSQVWRDLQVSDNEVRLHLQRKLRAQAFLRFKTENSGVQISDSDAEKYFEKNRVKFGGLPFLQFKDQIKKVMTEEIVQGQLEDWFELLRRKYRVRLLSPTENANTKL